VQLLGLVTRAMCVWSPQTICDDVIMEIVKVYHEKWL